MTIIHRIDFIMTVFLFAMGLYTMVVKTNLIKKLIGLNIMETSVYLFFIALGDVRLGPYTDSWGTAPFAKDVDATVKGLVAMVNPVPSALILTAIVVSVSVTALALALAVKLYQHYGTLDSRKMSQLKG
jgi:multicomponent Na+:H+ antiporter subunit C